MIPVFLPFDERRACVRGFWLSLCALLAGLFIVVAWWSHAIREGIAGVVLAALLGSVPLVGEGFARRAYRAWNHWLVRPFAASAQRVVMATLFLIVAIVSKMEHRSHGAESSGTMWKLRGSLPASGYGALFAGGAGDAASGAWISDYVRWAQRTGNLWATSLLPLLILLKALGGEEETRSQENIYTLF
jgi:hypothetical protein